MIGAKYGGVAKICLFIDKFDSDLAFGALFDDGWTKGDLGIYDDMRDVYNGEFVYYFAILAKYKFTLRKA